MLLAKYYSSDQIKKNGMGAACGTYGGKREANVFWWGNLKETDHLEALDVDDIKMDLQEIRWENCQLD